MLQAGRRVCLRTPIISKYALYLYGGTSGVVKGGSSRVPTGRIFDNPLGLAGIERQALLERNPHRERERQRVDRLSLLQ